MKVHHVFSFQEKIFFREVSCHCLGFERECTMCFDVKSILRPLQPSIGSSTINTSHTHSLQTLNCSDWVAVVYNCKWYLGQVKESSATNITISFMQERKENVFSWPERPDVDNILPETVLCHTIPPSIRSKNRRITLFSLEEGEYERVCELYSSFK
jgi:hypothetical protein